VDRVQVAAVSIRWCLASYTIEQSCGMEPGVSENVELSCDREEHEDVELHYDRKRALWWQEDSERRA